MQESEDSFVDAFDSILSSTDKLNTSINKDDLTMSLKVRRKYGLNDDSNSDQTQSYEALFRSIDEELGNYSKNPIFHDKSHRNYEKEIAIMQAVLQLITRKLMDELVQSGQPVENEHPLLDPLLALIELILYHGYHENSNSNGIAGSVVGVTEDIFTSLFKKKLSLNLWTFIESIEKNPSISANSSNAIENVRQFSMLSTISSKIRTWIRLGLLNKCIGIDLQFLIGREKKKKKNEDALNASSSSSSSHPSQNLPLFLESLWEEWACIRSDAMGSICNLFNSLDAIDFNLYIREQDIPLETSEFPWERIFQYDDRIDFLCIKPIIRVPTDFYINYFSKDDGNEMEVGGEEREIGENGKSASKNNLYHPSNSEDLKRLRKALVSQINQRTYFEQECTRLNKKLVTLDDELHSIKLKLKEVLKRERVMIEREKEREERMKLASPLLRTSPSMDAISRTTSISTRHALLPLPTSASSLNVTKSVDYLYQEVDREQQWKTREKELLQQIEILTQIKEEYKQRLKKSNK